MTIQISCSAPARFTAQKGRKLLVPVQITLFASIGLSNPCRVRASFISAPLGGLSIQAIPNMWTAVSASVVESTDFDPNGTLPVFTAFAAFFDPSPGPTTGYTASYTVEVIEGSNVRGLIQFGLTGDASAAKKVDVIFALDHGASMGRPDPSDPRLTRLQTAFSRGVALLRDDDTLGVVTFGNLKCPQNPQLAPGPANAAQQAAAITLAGDLVVDTSVPTSTKCIQMGIDAARALSQTATLVLITDGLNRDAPGHTLAQQTLPTSALIIGEGPPAIPASAPLMVSADGDYAFASAQTLGEFAIEKLLTQVLIGLGGSTFLSDPEGSLAPGGSQSFPLQITEADHEVEVIVFSNDAGPLQVRVSGLQAGEPHHGEQHQYVERVEPAPNRGKGYVITRIPIPRLSPREDIHPKVTVSRAPCAAHEDATPVRFNLLVVAKTDLRLDAEVTASGTSVGSDLLFSAVLSEYGPSWSREGVSVHVELSHPDGGVQKVHLHECAPGRFQASLRSFRAGAYTAHFIATGKSLLQCRTFQREYVRTVAVFQPSECCTPQDPCASVY
jgi:hypothetical protein